MNLLILCCRKVTVIYLFEKNLLLLYMKNKEDVKQFFSWNIIIIQLLKIIISETEAKIISSLESFFSFPNINERILKTRTIFVSQFPSPLPPYLNSREKCQRARFESSAKKFLSFSLFLPGWINGSRGRRWRFCCHWNVQERPEDRNSDEHRAVLHGVAWR